MANIKKSAQEMQDEIFRNMSADEKVKVGSYLWKMAKEIAGNKVACRGRGFEEIGYSLTLDANDLNKIRSGFKFVCSEKKVI